MERSFFNRLKAIIMKKGTIKKRIELFVYFEPLIFGDLTLRKAN